MIPSYLWIWNTRLQKPHIMDFALAENGSVFKYFPHLLRNNALKHMDESYKHNVLLIKHFGLSQKNWSKWSEISSFFNPLTLQTKSWFLVKYFFADFVHEGDIHPLFRDRFWPGTVFAILMILLFWWKLQIYRLDLNVIN